MNTHPPSYPPPDDAQGLDWSEVRALIRRRYRLFLAVFIVVLAATALINAVMRPVYEAEAAIAIRDPTPAPLTGLASSDLFVFPAATPSLEALQWVLTQPALLEAVIGRLELEDSVHSLARRLRIEPLGVSLILVRIEDTDRHRAARVANEIAQLHVEKSDARARQASAETLEFIGVQLERARERLDLSEAELLDLKSSLEIVDLEAEAQKALGTVASLSQAVASAKSDRAAARETADYYRGVLAREQERHTSEITFARNPLLEGAQQRLAALETEYAAKSATLGPAHPEMRRLREQIAATRDEVASTLERLLVREVEAANPAHAAAAQHLVQAEAAAIAAQARERAIEGLMRRETERLTALPHLQSDIARLQREAAIAAALYDELTRSYERARVRLAEATGPVEVFSLARVPEGPVRPRATLNMALGAVAGFAIALVLLVLAEALSDVLRTEEHARSELGLPLLASVPRAPAAALTACRRADPASPVADAFRTAAANLQLSAPKDAPSCLLIAGPGARVGRTTAALHLACAFARSGRSTLLVDGDLRQPAVHEALAINAAPGLADVLRSPDALDAALQPGGLGNLEVLAAGSEPGEAGELLQAPQVRAVLERMRGRYDVTVVDTARWPCADATLLASLCTGTVVVVRIGHTGRQEARRLVEDLLRIGGRPVGFIARH